MNKICNGGFLLSSCLWFIKCAMSVCLVAQSCPTLRNPMDYSLPGSSVHADSSGKNTEVGCHALLQGIVPTQRSNPHLPHCWRILYCLCRQRNPKFTIKLCKVYYEKKFRRNNEHLHCFFPIHGVKSIRKKYEAKNHKAFDGIVLS